MKIMCPNRVWVPASEWSAGVVGVRVRVWPSCSEHIFPGETLKLFQTNEQPTSRAAIPYEVLNKSQTPVMWLQTAKMARFLFMFTVHSLQLHQTFHLVFTPSHPLPRLRTGVDTCSLPLGTLHWPSLPELFQHLQFFHNNNSDDNKISFILVQHHHRLTTQCQYECRSLSKIFRVNGNSKVAITDLRTDWHG